MSELGAGVLVRHAWPPGRSGLTGVRVGCWGTGLACLAAWLEGSDRCQSWVLGYWSGMLGRLVGGV
ncbi:hypothetical protein ACQU0X_26845 [Pseudovibrio ascidiaceicola]|uniref:hypothetical protein n=1 Tax=Pseudovibrio ascidiaceicola TaxID=285279 RepID=UPI003D369E1B